LDSSVGINSEYSPGLEMAWFSQVKDLIEFAPNGMPTRMVENNKSLSVADSTSDATLSKACHCFPSSGKENDKCRQLFVIKWV
jgi:hypothetical protein